MELLRPKPVKLKRQTLGNTERGNLWTVIFARALKKLSLILIQSGPVRRRVCIYCGVWITRENGDLDWSFK